MERLARKVYTPWTPNTQKNHNKKECKIVCDIDMTHPYRHGDENNIKIEQMLKNMQIQQGMDKAEIKQQLFDF